jgi:glutamyl-tRNA synthetase
MAISMSKAPIYDRAALSISDEQKRKLDDACVRSYWRFKLPNKVISWNDIISGEITYDLNNISDPVVKKADGTYLYTFSSIIDDNDSGVTHIIRGQDHVTNTAVQIAVLDEIAKWNGQLQFAHLSLLVNKDGSQFSKRFGSTNLQDIRNKGIDPMAVSCLMATLGTSMDVVPFLKMQDLIKYFDITKFSTNSPKFDVNDIIKLNKKILHLKPYDEIKQYGLSEMEFNIIKNNVSSYDDFKHWKSILDREYIPICILSDSEKNFLKLAIDEISMIHQFDYDSCEAFLNSLSKLTGKVGKDLYAPLRSCLTGMDHGPNMIHLLCLLGKNEVLRRLSIVSQYKKCS